MRFLILAALGLGILAGAAHAEDGAWEVRVRALQVSPLTETHNADLRNNGAQLSVHHATVPEIDLSYYYSPHLAVEVIAATSRHAVNLGSNKLGNVSVLPPTLTAQYHFLPGNACIQPYVGAGLNYTRYYASNLQLGTIALQTTQNSFGLALQAGMDIPIQKYGFINLDVKKITNDGIEVKTPNDTVVTHLHINPIVWGIGYGIRF